MTPEPEQPKTERRMRGRGVSKLHSDAGDGRPPEVQEAKQDARRKMGGWRFTLWSFDVAMENHEFDR